MACIAAARQISEAEKAFRQAIGTTLFVQVMGSSQIEKSSVRHQAWGESRDWAFFSHCCNSLGGNIRSTHPCGPCDSHTAFAVACIRSTAFMPDLGTQFLESVNGSIASKASKRNDFPLTHWPRAQIAVMNRTLRCGTLGVANLIREELRLPILSAPAAKVVSDHERKNTRVSLTGEYQTDDQKKQRTADRYTTKADKSRLIAVWKGLSAADVAENEIHPSGFGAVDLASVRGKFDAITGDDKGPGKDGRAQDGGTAGGKGKGSRKRSAALACLPDYTAAGSDTSKNAIVLADVRTGGKKARVCAECTAAGVGLQFLADKQHQRKGQKICRKVREEWAAKKPASRTSS
ncbi:unnamed protein product [Ectocarpus sp. CCAP 1310/34]|nr:unnamed protein product [Ectocarpus sp. CCAP 1310/34]